MMSDKSTKACGNCIYWRVCKLRPHGECGEPIDYRVVALGCATYIEKTRAGDNGEED
jgi:hypothetical protein